jgi:AraC-like DNA-binding protein
MQPQSIKSHPVTSNPSPTLNVGNNPGQPSEGFTLESHMADEKTRVFNYNGRELVSILGREKFPGERIYKLPTKVIEFASRQPLTSVLLPCRVGYFPNARGQKVTRPNGDWAFTLLLCIDGVGHLELADSSHRLSRGMVAVLRPFEFHAYAADEKHPWSYYWIHFNGTLAQQYYEALTRGGKHTCVELELDVAFVRSFEKILNLYHTGLAHKMLVQAAAALHQLLGDLYGQICNHGIEQETPQSRIERTIDAVRNNLNMHASIHELAAIANMSDAYYAQQFRRHTGESPRSYFNKLRIKVACEYLAQTGAKIDTISHLVGYEDSFYFCRLFKRITGQTPTGYRKGKPSGAGSLKGGEGESSRGAKATKASLKERTGKGRSSHGGGAQLAE